MKTTLFTLTILFFIGGIILMASKFWITGALLLFYSVIAKHCYNCYKYEIRKTIKNI